MSSIVRTIDTAATRAPRSKGGVSCSCSAGRAGAVAGTYRILQLGHDCRLGSGCALGRARVVSGPLVGSVYGIRYFVERASRAL
jgi:hypothetical protein